MNNINFENLNLFLKNSWNYNEYDNINDTHNKNYNKKKQNIITTNYEKYKKILSVKDTVEVLTIYLKDHSIDDILL